MTRSAVPLAYFILLLFDSGDEIAGDSWRLSLGEDWYVVTDERRTIGKDHFQQR